MVGATIVTSYFRIPDWTWKLGDSHTTGSLVSNSWFSRSERKTIELTKTEVMVFSLQLHLKKWVGIHRFLKNIYLQIVRNSCRRNNNQMGPEKMKRLVVATETERLGGKMGRMEQ